MGLDTTHDCFHGSYSTFGAWRKALCQVAGYGDIDKRQGFCEEERAIPWPDNDPLCDLLAHSDCDGELPLRSLPGIAVRLEECLPAMKRAEWGATTERFIAGLRVAIKKKQKVKFE